MRSVYTINRKYLERFFRIRQYAKAGSSQLYSETTFNYKPFPLVAFKYSGQLKRAGILSINVTPPTVTIKKGKSETFKHGFLASVKAQSKNGEHYEHVGIFAVGKYEGENFKYDKIQTASGRYRITELHSVSAFTMATSADLQPNVNGYGVLNLPKNVRFRLQKLFNQSTQNSKT